MAATRQDAWSEDNDLLLAEVTLRHIREGSTQLAAFEEVGYRLGRTAAACGFRWNSAIRKKYDSAIQIAKAQRQQLKSRGKRRFIPEHEPVYASANTSMKEYMGDYGATAANGKTDAQEVYQNGAYNNESHQLEVSTELNDHSMGKRQPASIPAEELQYDDVIRFLRYQKENIKKLRTLEKELQEKEKEIHKLREENQTMKKDLGSVKDDYQTINEDYHALIKIMDRARKLAFLSEEEQEEKVKFKMDKNGNLERVEK